MAGVPGSIPGVLVEMSSIATTPVCPACGSTHVVYCGHDKRGTQRLLCRGCGKKSREPGGLGGRHFPPETVGRGIEIYYRGYSCKATAQFLSTTLRIHDPDISPQTVSLWVQTYSRVAATAMEGRKAFPGVDWDLIAVLLDGLRVWWVVLDQETGYILGCHLARGEPRDGAREAMAKAKLASVGRCRRVDYREVRPSRRWRTGQILEQEAFRGIRSALPQVALSRPFQRADVIYGEFKVKGFLTDLKKVALKFNRVKDPTVLATYLGGWVVSRNCFVGQWAGQRRSSGNLAQVEAPFAGWTDVVRYSVSSSRRLGSTRQNVDSMDD